MSSPPARPVTSQQQRTSVSPSAWSSRGAAGGQRSNSTTTTARHTLPRAGSATAAGATPQWTLPSQSHPREYDDNEQQVEFGIADAIRARNNNARSRALVTTVPAQLEQHQQEQSASTATALVGVPLWCKAQTDEEFELRLLEDEAVDSLTTFAEFSMQALISLQQQCARVVLWHRCLAAKQRDVWLELEARWVLLTGLAATRLRVKKRKVFSSAVGAVQRGIVAQAEHDREQRAAAAQVRAKESGVLSRDPRTLACALQVILDAQECRLAIQDEEKAARQKLSNEGKAGHYAARMHELDRENVVVLAAREKRRKRWEQLDPFLVRRRMPVVASAGMIFVPAPPPDEQAQDELGSRRGRHVVLRPQHQRNSAANSGRSSTAGAAVGVATHSYNSHSSNQHQLYGTVEMHILQQQAERESAVASSGSRHGTRNSHRSTGSAKETGGDIRGYSNPDQAWWPNPPAAEPGAAAAAHRRTSQERASAARDDDGENNVNPRRGSQLNNSNSNNNAAKTTSGNNSAANTRPSSAGGAATAPPLAPQRKTRSVAVAPALAEFHDVDEY